MDNEHKKELQPHQQRVVDERFELNDKATKLNDFIGNNPLFENIASDEQEDLKVQLDIMFQYIEVLDRRILRF